MQEGGLAWPWQGKAMVYICVPSTWNKAFGTEKVLRKRKVYELNPRGRAKLIS